MSASYICDHSNLSLLRSGQQFLDSNIRVMRIGFECLGCGQRFRVLGVHPGKSIAAPSTMDEGETTLLPIVPVGEEPDMDMRAMLS